MKRKNLLNKKDNIYVNFQVCTTAQNAHNVEYVIKYIWDHLYIFAVVENIVLLKRNFDEAQPSILVTISLDNILFSRKYMEQMKFTSRIIYIYNWIIMNSISEHQIRTDIIACLNK